MNSWQRYAVGSNQIVQTVRSDRNCYQMTAALDEPLNCQWGDCGDRDGQPVRRKRAQFRELYYQPFNEVYSLGFSTLIPDDWKPLTWRTSIMDLHPDKAAGGYSLNVENGELYFYSILERKELWRGICVPEQWDDWKLGYLPSINKDGWMKLWRNGNLVIDIKDVQTVNNDARGMYSKVGPYFFDPPHEVEMPRYRRMFVQINQ